METKDRIFDLAEKLANEISSLDISKKYYKLLDEIKNDEEALDVLSKLVNFGKQLNENIDNPETFQNSPESIQLRHELTHKPIVKEFIKAQNEYLSLIKEVMEFLNKKLNP